MFRMVTLLIVLPETFAQPTKDGMEATTRLSTTSKTGKTDVSFVILVSSGVTYIARMIVGYVFWKVNHYPIIYDTNLTLFCNTSAIKERKVTWMKAASVIVHHGTVFTPTKYSETINMEGSALTIKKITMEDLFSSYTCICDVFSYDNTLQLNGTNFLALPSANSTQITWSDSTGQMQVSFRNVSPIPKCQIILKENLPGNALKLTSQQDGILYNITIVLRKEYSTDLCDGNVKLRCSYGNRNYTPETRNVAGCHEYLVSSEKEKQNKKTNHNIVTFTIPTAVFILLVSGLVCYKLLKNEKHPMTAKSPSTSESHPDEAELELIGVKHHDTEEQKEDFENGRTHIFKNIYSTLLVHQ